MVNAEEEQKDIEIPAEDDENVGEGAPKKKKEKRKKTKEERIAERKVIFWTFILVMVTTLGFWLVPKIKEIFGGGPSSEETKQETKTNMDTPKERKNYVEITL